MAANKNVDVEEYKVKTKRQVAPFSSSSCLMVLEPRIMYDAAAVPTGAEVLADDQAALEQTAANHALPDDARQALHPLQELFSDYTPPVQDEPRELVFVADNIKDYQQLLGGVSPEARVIVLDSGQDGLQQMSAVLAQYHDLDAIHIVSHGGAASLNLGQQQLNLENIAAYGAELKEWGQALSSDGDIMLYGCDVAAGVQGQEFIHQLSEQTGADVAASTDITGSREYGGDWDLEHHEGTVEADLWGDVSQFHGVLTPPVLTAGGVLNYTENDTATVIDVSITLSNSPTIESATIAFTSNYASHQDELVFTDTGAITGSWNQATGTLTLTGSDTVINYENALRSVKYVNHSDEPMTSSRTVEFQAYDGTAYSTLEAATINITAVNDAPVLETSGPLVLPAINEGDAASPAYSMYDLYRMFGFIMDDPDYHDTLGIAVTGVDNTGGTWQYSTDGGVSWNNFANDLSATNATLLKGFQELTGKVTNTADLSAGNLLINGTDIGPVTLTGSLTYGSNTQGAYNLASAVNGVSGTTGVIAELDTMYAGIAATGSNVSAETIEFDINGSHVTVGIPVNSSIYDVARAVVNAVNALSDRYDLHAWVGSGSNGGMANSVVIEHFGSIVISNLVESGTATSGLTSGTYALDASHNRGEIILLPTAGSFTVTTSAGDDSVLARIGLDGGVAKTYVTGDAPGDGAISVSFPHNKFRFVPNAGFSGKTTLSFRAWDQTNGLANGLTGVDVSPSGGSTPYSADTVTSSLDVKAVSVPVTPPPIQPPPQPPPGRELPTPPESLPPMKPALEPPSEPPPYFEPLPLLFDPGTEPAPDLLPDVDQEGELAPEAEAEELLDEEKAEDEESAEEDEAAAEEGKEETAEEATEQGAEEIAAVPAAEAGPPADVAPEGQGEQGLNEQLAKEAKKTAAERAEIVKIFEEVYELLQCK